MTTVKVAPMHEDGATIAKAIETAANAAVAAANEASGGVTAELSEDGTYWTFTIG